MIQPRTMLVSVALGAALGAGARAIADRADPRFGSVLRWTVDHVSYPLGQVFLRALFMLVVPLLFSALVMGVGELELGRLGKVALKMLGYTVVVSTIAVLIGLVAVNVLQPGRGFDESIRQAALSGPSVKAAATPQDTSAIGLLLAVVPDNPLKAAASGDMLGWLTFSLVFGVGLALTRTEAAATLRAAIQGLYDVTMKLVEIVLRLAPVGVGALLFTMTARLGAGVLRPLLSYVGVVLLALGLHMFVVYPLSVRFLGGMSPVRFFKDTRLAIVTAFSTSSSSATLPVALRVAEENLRLPRSISRFVLTAGSTMNQNGTALFEGVTVLFLAQLFGVDLSVPQQALIMIICILAGIGTAGVPAGSIPVIAMILGLFRIPPDGLGLILGVDRFLDMCRTTLNVTGDLAAAVYVSHGESDDPAGAWVSEQE